jgi:hypothetical protein
MMVLLLLLLMLLLLFLRKVLLLKVLLSLRVLLLLLVAIGLACAGAAELKPLTALVNDHLAHAGAQLLEPLAQLVGLDGRGEVEFAVASSALLERDLTEILVPDDAVADALLTRLVRGRRR